MNGSEHLAKPYIDGKLGRNLFTDRGCAMNVDPSRMLLETRSRLLQAVESANVAQAEAILSDFAQANTHSSALIDILEPTLVEIGEKWATGKPMILAQGYLAAKLTESLLSKVLEERHGSTSIANNFGPVILGNIEDDYHALGRRMVAIFLKAAGWAVHDLGNDVPAEEFIKVAKETGAKVIGASAMMYTTAVNIKKLRAAIDESGLKGRVQLAVGGAVFNLRPELVDEVGADGSARSALLAPELFEELSKRAAQVECAQ